MQLYAHVGAFSAVYLILSGTLHCFIFFILFIFSYLSSIYSNFVILLVFVSIQCTCQTIVTEVC